MNNIVMYNELYEKDWRDVFAQYWAYITNYKVTKEQIKSCQDYILNQVIENKVFMFLCVDNNKVIGFSISQIDNENSDWNRSPGYGFIREFFILSNQRKKGCGKMLAHHTIKNLFLKGSKNIYLDTDKNAKEFWIKCGFISTGKFDEDNSNEILIYNT